MRLNPYLLSVSVVIILSINTTAARFYIPAIDGDWWRVASTPDIGEYNSDKQQPVDFSLWQAKDGTWQLWSCIRFTKLGGHSRLFYGWEGGKLTDKDWTPKGIAMMGKTELGEPLGGLQAPHVIHYKEMYWMMYGDWDNMRMAASKDGKAFERLTSAGVLFSEGPRVNTRDPMLLFTQGKWNCYYTAFPAQHGYVYCRTSDDLLTWSDPVIVSYGGKAGNNPFSCECPHVVEISPGNYFLFRTQLYGPGAQTTVYQSANPFHFGIDNDAGYVRQMNLCAPEIVTLDGKYYIAALNSDLDGVRVARLKWKCFDKAVFPIDDLNHRAQWKLKEGNLTSVFTNTVRDRFCPRAEYFIGTAETGQNTFNDTLTGVIQSPVCKITADECILFVSGGKDAQQVYISIEDAKNAQEYARFTGKNDNLFDPVFVDCRAFINKEVVIKIVDQSIKSWGHINFGGLYEADSAGDL